MKDASGNAYKASVFFAQAQAAYAKSIIFAAEARCAIKKDQYLWAAVSAYYSLFHFTISLMYILPIYVRQDLLNKLLAFHLRGAADPTREIKHNDLQ